MKVVLLVRSLERGGAERQVVMLARGLRAAGIEVAVVVFYEGGAFEADLTAAGVRLVSADKAGRWDVVGFVSRLARVIHDERPDVLYGFMVTPNLLGLLLRPLLPNVRIVWGIRSSRLTSGDNDWLSRLLGAIESGLARLPDLVIANSEAGARELARRGFSKSKVAVVQNGIDVEAYVRDPAGRARIRGEWEIRDEELLVGMVARPNPVKAHGLFLEAAALVLKKEKNARFVCVGVGDELAAANLRARAKQLALRGCMHIEGPRDGLSAVYSALDVLVMCSNSEGFPNVVAEGMACEVPCAVTDAGDAFDIVGDTGECAPPKQPEELARAILALLARLGSDRTLGQRARSRIVDNYSIAALANRTLAAFDKLTTEESAAG